MQALLDAISRLHLPTDAQRIFHGRGGLYPDSAEWALDFFPPVFLVTHFAALREQEDSELQVIGSALAQRWIELNTGQELNWVYQRRFERTNETRLMAGQIPLSHQVSEHGAQFLVHLERGQNHGLFLDMAAGRCWVRQCVARHCTNFPRGPKVLNLFAYTCAFSVVALQAGARHVVNVDMSRTAMAVGQQNHRLNDLASGASFLVHDIFSTWGKINRGGPYDLVIVDPPSYQKGSFIATKDYARLMRRLPDLLAPGGHALLCLNAPELGESFLRDQMQELASALIFRERLSNPAEFADVDADRSLKVFVYEAPGIS